MNVGVAILRLKEGLDCSEILVDIDDVILNKASGETSETSTGRLSPDHETSVMSNSNLSQIPTGTSLSSTVILSDPTILLVNCFFKSVRASSITESLGESTDQEEDNRAVVLGVTKSKKSKKKQKQAITFR
jgi:hypothetical protein